MKIILKSIKQIQAKMQQTLTTQADTPPALELVESESREHKNLQLLHKIINSNEELIHQQMKQIKQLQIQLYQEEHARSIAQQKYHVLFQSMLQSNQKDITENSQDQLQNREKVDLNKLLQKIAELEIQLMRNKMQLATQNQQLLKKQFQYNLSFDQIPRNRNNSKANIQELIPIEMIRKQNDIFFRKSKNSEEEEALMPLWNKALEFYTNQNQSKLIKFKEKTTSLVKKMIPQDLRHKVWPLLFKNILGFTNSLYIELLDRRSNGWVSEKVKLQIEKDIKRSFYGKTTYEARTGLVLDVTEVLQIFYLYRPDVSYIQGMTYPVIVLTLVVGKIKAFRIFSNLIIGNVFFRRIFTFEGNFLMNIARSFETLLEEYNPEISKKLKEMKIESEIYLIQWFYTFFSRGLSFDIILKFWDHLAYFEELAIYRFALSIFEVIGERILNTSYEETIGLIRDYGSFVNQDKLIEVFSNHKLTQEKLTKTLEKYEQNN